MDPPWIDGPWWIEDAMREDDWKSQRISSMGITSSQDPIKGTTVSRDSLPRVGMRVRIKGDHPWTGDKGRVVSVDRVGLRRTEMAKVILERDDAMNGHGCYIGERNWELLSFETKEY